MGIVFIVLRDKWAVTDPFLQLEGKRLDNPPSGGFLVHAGVGLIQFQGRSSLEEHLPGVSSAADDVIGSLSLNGRNQS